MEETRISAPCAVCGESRTSALFTARDPDGTSERPFSVVRCGSCGLAYVSPRPDTAALSRYYGPGFYDRPGEDSGLVGRSLNRLFMLERVAKATAGRPPGRVLDVGCGEGSFLAAMARSGWESWGVDISKDGAARASARPGVKIFGKSLEECSFEPASFDLVTMWHSIEHVPDPASLLRRIAGLIKDDGAVFLAFPNGESWEFRLFGPRWFHLDPPRHLHYFSPRTMSRLLGGCGLRVESVSHLSWEYNPFGFAQSVMNTITTRFNFLYRRLKGTLPRGEASSAFDVWATALLFPLFAAASLPYVLLAALCGASGCVDTRAVKSGA